MIIKIKQNKTNFDMSWIATNDEEQIALCEAPLSTKAFRAFFHYNEPMFCEHEHLYFNQYDDSFGSKLSDRLSFKVFDGDNLIGNMVAATRKTGKWFFNGYSYYKVTFKNRYLECYQVGFGYKGLYVCIYENDQCIAIAEKEIVVKNYRDSYTVYMLNENDLDVVFPFIVYFDTIEFGDFLEVSLGSLNTTVLNSTNKQLIEKFDQSFIDKIIALNNK